MAKKKTGTVVALPIEVENEKAKEIVNLCTDLALVLLERYVDFDGGLDRLCRRVFASTVPTFDPEFNEAALDFQQGSEATVNLICRMIDDQPLSAEKKEALQDTIFHYGFEEGLFWSKLSLAFEIFERLIRLCNSLHRDCSEENSHEFVKKYYKPKVVS